MTMTDDDPLDPKRKIYDALAPGGTATGPGPEMGGMETMPTSIPSPIAPPSPSGASAAPSWSKGANAGKNNGMILGFETDKLNDPGSGKAAGSKYTGAAKAFSGGLKEDVGVSRGGLDNMLNYIKANGFEKAQIVGDDKIDFGDGNGPIDVIRSDGQIVFQNTSGNPVWEGQGFKPDTAGGGGPSFGGGASALTQMDPLLSGDPLAKIQAALAQMQGPRSNAAALLAALGGR